MGNTPEDTGPKSVVELRESLLEGIVDQAGIEAASQARALLDYVQATIPPEQAEDMAVVQDQLVSRSVPFIQRTGDRSERHLRLLGVSHLLVSLIRPAVVRTEDEYITSRFEDLSDRLMSLEKVEEANPQVDHRLTAIYQGLVELASALGLSSCDALCFQERS